MPGLVEHLEAQLGEIRQGWSRDADGLPLPFQVAGFERGSGENSVAFCTLGLSRHQLTAPTGAVMHQELLVLLLDKYSFAPIPSILQQLGKACLDQHRPLLRGEVLGPAGPLVEGTEMEALYVTSPVYFPDEFGAVQEGGREIIIVWLVPITRAEASFVAARGWDAFEDLLIAEDPNLMDLSRSSLV